MRIDTGWDRDLVVFSISGGRCRTHRQRPLGGPSSTSSSASVVNAVVPTDSAPRGPPSTSSSTMVVDTAKPVGSAPRGLPLTSSSTSVMDATGPAGSAPQGACHRHRLQHRWWTLPDPLTAPPKGLAIDVFLKLSVGRCRWVRQCPQGACHRCLLQPPSTSCNKW
jgi:hypothetical protein